MNDGPGNTGPTGPPGNSRNPRNAGSPGESREHDARNRGQNRGKGLGQDPGQDRAPRVPPPRTSMEAGGGTLPPAPRPPAVPALEHRVLMSLLGAWALAACSPEETAAVEEHLGDCGPCAEEALRLRGAVGLLHPPESLDLDPGLRTRVLDTCLERRRPRIPVPAWAVPYDAETARLDALLQDIGDAEWHAPVRLRWFDGRGPAGRRTTVAGVLTHLRCVDGLVASALGLDDPLAEAGPDEDSYGHGSPGVVENSPTGRTEAYWRAARVPPTRAVRGPWREQSRAVVRTAAFAGGGSGDLTVSYGEYELPLRDAMVDRAFECWVHADDIAEAVDYPYEPPAPRHLHGMVDLAARMLPLSLAARRRAGLAEPAPRGRHLVAAGAPGRSLRLEIEGLGGGEWLIPLDSPGAAASSDHAVAHIALDGVEFCRLAAGHVPPAEAAAGHSGDRTAIQEVLLATASLSRL